MSTEPDESPWVDARWIARRLGVSAKVVRRWGLTSHEGFPAGTRFSRSVVRWRRSEIEAWEAARAAS